MTANKTPQIFASGTAGIVRNSNGTTLPETADASGTNKTLTAAGLVALLSVVLGITALPRRRKSHTDDVN